MATGRASRDETDYIWVLELALEKKRTLVKLECARLYRRKGQMTVRRYPGEATHI
jgi:hypothetical protein